MLSTEERAEIEALVKNEEFPSAAAVAALRALQRRRGWVPDEGLADIAPLLDITPAELDSVASFYNLIFRKPVGKHVILLCNSVTCWAMGYDKIREHIQERLKIIFGETTPDGEYNFLPIVCLGDCDHAPVMLVDDQLHRDLSPESVDASLPEYTGEPK